MYNEFIKLQLKALKGKGLSITDKVVYSTLVSKFNYHNEPFYTYESYLADELEISEKTIARSLKKLEEVGLISIERRYNNETKKTVNYYSINNSTEGEINHVETTENNETIEDTKKEEKPVRLEINTVKDEYQQLASAIETKYNSTPDKYFANINKLSDITYNLLEELSDASETNPQVVLDFIKEIRKIA